MTPLQEFSLFTATGPFVWPLLLLSLLALVFFFERAHFLHKGQIRAGEFLRGIKNALSQGHLVEALTACEETPGPIPRIVKAILLRTRDGEAGMRSAAESAAILEIPALERRVGTIAAAAKLAPLLGFTGTLFALTRAFLHMQGQGHYATADAFAADIASALAVTALGLMLSVLAHLAHHFLYGRVRSIVHDMEWAAHETIQFICHELPDPAPPKTETNSAN
jgi:biopolymer transport protein ExbB